MVNLNPNSHSLREVNHCHGKGAGHPCEGGTSGAKIQALADKTTAVGLEHFAQVAKAAEKTLDRILGGPKASRAVRKKANIDSLSKLTTSQLEQLDDAYHAIKKADKAPGAQFRHMAGDRVRQELASRKK